MAVAEIFKPLCHVRNGNDDFVSSGPRSRNAYVAGRASNPDATPIHLKEIQNFASRIGCLDLKTAPTSASPAATKGAPRRR